MKLAVAQLTPILLDRARTLGKVIAAIDEAAAGGARLVAFGETLVPAYPVWLSNTDGARFESPLQKQLHGRYVEQAVVIGEHLEGVCEAARRGGIAVVLGVAERDPQRGHSLFCSRVFIDAEGRIASVHRKLMPTYEERLAWGIGDGAGLVTHPVGPFTVGALNCWENWMPLARAALYAQGEDLHIMLWPGALRLTESLTPVIARELRGFVVSASGFIPASSLPVEVGQHMPGVQTGYDGGSCVAGPDGRWLIPPIVDREAVEICEVDPMKVLEERQNFDPCGHYSRPDVLGLTVDRRRPRAAHFIDGSEPTS